MYRLAQLMGRDARYLNTLQHDRSEPRFTTILLIAKALNMDPGDLVRAAAKLSWAAVEDEEVGAPSDDKLKIKNNKSRTPKIRNSKK